MKKVLLLLLALSLFFLLGCNSSIPDDVQSPSTSETKADSALQMPDEMKELVKNPDTQWMGGMLVVIDNAEMTEKISQESYEVYTDPGDEVQATVTVQNGLDKVQRFDFMVFADGVPVEFTVDGKQYLSYPVDLTPQQKKLAVEFEKEFVLNMGRLDFVMSFAEDSRALYHMITYTVWIESDGESRQPASLCDTVPQRTGLQNSYSDNTYNSWIWNAGVTPADMDNVGPTAVSIQNGETVLLEAIAGSPGFYRTVLIVNDAPVAFNINGEKYPYLDWESTGSNILQIPVTIADIDSGSCIYTITTPLDTTNRALSILASAKTELTVAEGGKTDGTGN